MQGKRRDDSIALGNFRSQKRAADELGVLRKAPCSSLQDFCVSVDSNNASVRRSSQTSSRERSRPNSQFDNHLRLRINRTRGYVKHLFIMRDESPDLCVVFRKVDPE